MLQVVSQFTGGGAVGCVQLCGLLWRWLVVSGDVWEEAVIKIYSIIVCVPSRTLYPVPAAPAGGTVMGLLSDVTTHHPPSPFTAGCSYRSDDSEA